MPDESVFSNPYWQPDQDIVTSGPATDTAPPSPDRTEKPKILNQPDLTPEQVRAGALPFATPEAEKLDYYLRPDEGDKTEEPKVLPTPSPTPVPTPKEEKPTWRQQELQGTWYATNASTFGGGDDGPDPGDPNHTGAWGKDTLDPQQRGIALPEDAIATFYNTDPHDPTFESAVRNGQVLVQVYNPVTDKYAIGPLIDIGPAPWTGKGIDLLQATAKDLGISDPRNWTGQLAINPWYDPNNTEKPKQTAPAPPTETDSASVKSEFAVPLSPADKWRQAHPEDANTTDEDLAKKVQGLLKLDKADPGKFGNAFTIRDDGRSLQYFYDQNTNALARFRAQYPDYDKVSDSDLLVALYKKNHGEGESYEQFALRWKPLSDGSALSLVNGGADIVSNFHLLTTGITQLPGVSQTDAALQSAQKWSDGLHQWWDQYIGTPITTGVMSTIANLGFRYPAQAAAFFSGWLKGDQASAEWFHTSFTKPLSEKIFGTDIFGITHPINTAAGNMYRVSLKEGMKQALEMADLISKPSEEKFQQLRLGEPWYLQTTSDILRGMSDASWVATFVPGMKGVQLLMYSSFMSNVLAGGDALLNKKPRTFMDGLLDTTDAAFGSTLINGGVGKLKGMMFGTLYGQSDQFLRDWLDGKHSTLEEHAVRAGTDAAFSFLMSHKEAARAVDPHAYFERPKAAVIEREPVFGPPKLPGTGEEPVETKAPGGMPHQPGVMDIQRPGGGNRRIWINEPAEGRTIVWLDVDALKDLEKPEDDNKEGRQKLIAKINAGLDVKAPEVSLDQNGKLIYSNLNELDAMRNLHTRGWDWIPVDVDSETAGKLAERGWVLPWEEGKDPANAVVHYVNGEPLVKFSPAQEELIEEAHKANEAGDTKKARTLLGTIFAGLPKKDQASILASIQKMWEGFDKLKPDSDQAAKTVADAQKDKAPNPEEDKSNPDGVLPTSPDMDAESFRLGAHNLALFQQHWDNLDPKLIDRLARRFNVVRDDPLVKEQLWGRLRRFYDFLRDNGEVPRGLSRPQWDKLSAGSRTAIALSEATGPGVIWDVGAHGATGYEEAFTVDAAGKANPIYFLLGPDGARLRQLAWHELPEHIQFELHPPSEREHGPPAPIPQRISTPRLPTNVVQGILPGGQPRQPGNRPGVAGAQRQGPRGVPAPHGAGAAGGERGGNETMARAAADVIRRNAQANVGVAGVKNALLAWARANGLKYNYRNKGPQVGNPGVEHVAHKHPTDPNKIVKFFLVKEKGFRAINFGDAVMRLEEVNKGFNEEFYGFDKFIGVAVDQAGDVHLVFEQPFIKALEVNGVVQRPDPDQRKAWLEHKGYIVLNQYEAYNPFTRNKLGDLHEDNVILEGFDANGIPICKIIDSFIAPAKVALIQRFAGRTPARFPTGGLGPEWTEKNVTTLMHDPKKERVELEHVNGQKAVLIRDKPGPPAQRPIDDVVKMERRPVLDQNGQPLLNKAGRRKGYWHLSMVDKHGQVHERRVMGNKPAALAQQKAMYDFYNNQRTGDPHNPHDPNLNFYAGPGTIGQWDAFMDTLWKGLEQIVRPIAQAGRSIGKFVSDLPPIKRGYHLAADVLGLDIEWEGEKGGDIARGQMKAARAQVHQALGQFMWTAAKRAGLANVILGGVKPQARAAVWATKNHEFIKNALANYQRGLVHPDPQIQAILTFYRHVQDAIYKTEQLLGINYRYVDNYFYGLYDNPRKANAAINRWESFLFKRYGKMPDYVKAKVFHDYLEADIAGYNARFYNPERIFQARVAGFFHNVNKILAFRGLLDAGLMVKRDDPLADQWKRENGIRDEKGWLKAHNGEEYMPRPDVYHLVRNAFDPSDTVRLYGGWLLNPLRWLKGVTTTLELGLSILHSAHIAGISAADLWAEEHDIPKNSFAGRVGYRMMTLANAVRNVLPWDRIQLGYETDSQGRKTERFLNLPFASYRGHRDLLAYLRGEGPKPTDPQTDHILGVLRDAGFGVNQLHEASLGFIDNMAEMMGGKGWEVSQDWLDKIPAGLKQRFNIPNQGPYFFSWRSLGLDSLVHQRMGVLPTLYDFGRILTGESWFRDQMMHRQIPMAKIQAIVAAANSLFLERPDLKDPVTQAQRNERTAALSLIGHKVETRYGEMQYDNLFAARWLKTIGVNSLLSMGWKIGMFRTYGKAVYDLGKTALHLDEIIEKKRKQDPTGAFLTGDLKFALMYTAIVGSKNLMVSYLSSATQPDKKKWDLDWLDAVYPRIGTDNQGRAIRMRDPFWLGDYLSIYRHFLTEGWAGIGTLSSHWSNPAISIGMDLAFNQDYRGREITDPDKTLVDPQTLLDRIVYVMQHVTPISLQSSLYQSKNWRDALWGFFGYSPAASWTMRTPTENMILDYADKHRAGTFIQRREYREKQDAVQQYKFALSLGDRASINAARAALTRVHPPMSENQVLQIIKHAALSPAQAVFKTLTPLDKAKLIRRMPEAERHEWLRIAGPEGLRAYRDLNRSSQEQQHGIPKFGTGGIVTSPTDALVGDSGPEAIIPLDGGGQPEIITKPTIVRLGDKGPEKVVPLEQAQKGALSSGQLGAILGIGRAWAEEEDDTRAHPSPHPVPHPLDPVSGKTSTNPDFIVRHPFRAQKGGMVWADPRQDDEVEDERQDALASGQLGAILGTAKKEEDTVLPISPNYRYTYPEDFHTLEYNYGDKLPGKFALPIPQIDPYQNPQLGT